MLLLFFYIFRQIFRYSEWKSRQLEEDIVILNG